MKAVIENHDYAEKIEDERAELIALVQTLTPDEVEKVIALARQLLDPQ